MCKRKAFPPSRTVASVEAAEYHDLDTCVSGNQCRLGAVRLGLRFNCDLDPEIAGKNL
jgi:hypothetical protein